MQMFNASILVLICKHFCQDLIGLNENICNECNVSDIYESVNCIGSLSITYSGPIVWNSLPAELKNLDTVNSFHNYFIKWLKS